MIIGSARHDENGAYSGGKPGDNLQTSTSDYKGEVSLQQFYVHKKGWYILRPKDINLANGLSFSMALACANHHIGYDQTNRLGAYKYSVLANVDTESDCSGLVRACMKQCGHDVANFTTANEVSVLMATGLFDKITYKSGVTLYNGDVLVTKTKGHTVICVSGNQRKKNINPYAEPTDNIKIGSKGDGVKWVQWELNEKGAGLKIDGDAGYKTELAIKAYQNANGIVADGIVGPITKEKMKAD